MRHLISGLVTVVAVMTASAAPAMACGGGLFQSSCCGQAYVEPCAQPQVYVSPAPTYSYSGCNTGCGGGWAYERLPDPVHQYYYVNQGPTYSGPGNFAPYPTYEESALSAYEGTGAYGYRAHRHHSYRYGYAPRSHRYGYAHRSYRYGYAPRSYGPRYGYREHTLRRYY
jgi:hypothetical protein